MPAAPARPRRRLALAGSAAALVAVVAWASPASAHIGTEASSTAAGSTSIVRFKIGHGCEGSPTTEIRIQIPEGVTGVRPEATPGWDVETTVQGDDVTEVTWSGGSLPDDQFMQVGLSVVLPETPGETVWFPTVQTCPDGELAWIQIPEEGQPEPEEPAPGVEVTAAASGEEGGDDDGTDALAVVALVVGVVGVLLGGAGLALARRSRT